MVRSTIAVIVGYIVMFILQVATFMIIYSVMGPNWSFKPGSYQPSPGWTILQFIVILVTAAIAGLICQLIARGGKSPVFLAGVVLVIGLVLATMSNSMTPADTRPVAAGNIPVIEAMSRARHPVWVVFVNPFIAAVGVVAGGSLKRTR